MDIVIDTSVIIAVVTNEPHKQMLVDRTQSAVLYAPGSMQWEIGNAFSAMLKRRRVTLEEALAAMEASRQILFNVVDVDVSQAVALAGRLNIYAYDAYVIACALSRGCPLLSLDRGLLTAAVAAGVAVIEVT